MTLNEVGITIFLEIVRVLIIMLYFNIFYDTQNKKIHIITGSLSCLITTGSYLLFNINIVNLVATIAGIFIISLGFKGKISKKLLLSIMCYSLMIAIAFLVFSTSTTVISCGISGSASPACTTIAFAPFSIADEM